MFPIIMSCYASDIYIKLKFILKKILDLLTISEYAKHLLTFIPLYNPRIFISTLFS